MAERDPADVTPTLHGGNGTPVRRLRCVFATIRAAVARALAALRPTLPDDRRRSAAPFRIEYDPHPDGRPDPGEVVWTWVPFEEDPTRGKDRPVLIVARAGGQLIGLMLTSKDHDRDAARQAAAGRVWMDLGVGSWDRRGRPSEVRLDRLLRLDPARVRREGATVDRARFEAVTAAMSSTLGWAPPPEDHRA